MTSLQEKTVDFKEFAEFLFSHQSAPAEKSIVLNLQALDNDQQCSTGDFLYELFVYGYKKKYGDVDISELSEKHFENLRSYIRALGYDVFLDENGYTKDENGVVTHIKFGFSVLT